MKEFLFVVRLLVAWLLAFVAIGLAFKGLVGRSPGGLFYFLQFATLLWVLVSSISHIRRVRMVAERVDGSSYANRHRRQIEIPFSPEEAFQVVEAAVRELPYVDSVQSAKDSMQLYARVRRTDPYAIGKKPKSETGAMAPAANQVLAHVTARDRTASLTLICEPERGGWMDWFLVDYGTNLENADAITRAITRRVAEKRKGEEATVHETAAEKELAVAKLSLLHAQVEPHFLYNTLASAQVLTRSDPARAEQMLGHLISYLRNSLPKTQDSLSTLGEEVQRALSYLEILKIRMGERLRVQVQVPELLKPTPMPPMMLQTLVENAIKHGLEPETGGGTIWIIARESDGKVAVTVADDGRGFNEHTGGTAIGLKNVRERLALAYGTTATFAIVANFPKGVAATITVPFAPKAVHA